MTMGGEIMMMMGVRVDAHSRRAAARKAKATAIVWAAVALPAPVAVIMLAAGEAGRWRIEFNYAYVVKWQTEAHPTTRYCHKHSTDRSSFIRHMQTSQWWWRCYWCHRRRPCTSRRYACKYTGCALQYRTNPWCMRVHHAWCTYTYVNIYSWYNYIYILLFPNRFYCADWCMYVYNMIDRCISSEARNDLLPGYWLHACMYIYIV